MSANNLLMTAPNIELITRALLILTSPTILKNITLFALCWLSFLDPWKNTINIASVVGQRYGEANYISLVVTGSAASHLQAMGPTV